MAYLPRSLARLCGGIAVGASVATCLLSSATSAAAAAAPCANTTDGVSVVLASQSGTLSPACVTQQGNVLIIVLPQNTPGAALQTVTPTVIPVLNTLPTPVATEGDMSNVVDPRINSYAKRQAIRDQYRGQIDEVTFNDELGDGVQLDTALADALAAFKHLRP
jgi:hypothetical protein